MGRERCGRDYPDLAVFLRVTSRIHRFTHPYDAQFRNSWIKIFLISSVVLTTPVPSLITIHLRSELNFTLVLLEYGELVLVTGAVMACFYWLARNARKIEKVHKALADTHRWFQWKKLLQYSNRSMIVHDAFTAAAIAMYFGAYSVIPNPQSTRMIMCSVSYTVPMIAMHFFGASFRCALHVLNSQFRHLNKILNSLKPDQVIHHEFLVYGHCLMSNAFKKLNSAYRLPVVLWPTCTLVVVVYNLYDILTFNQQEGFYTTIGDTISGSAWMIFWVTELIVLVMLLERVVYEHEEFTAILHLKMIRDPSGLLSQSQKLGTHIAMRQKIECSAAGFFSVDYKLIASIASVTTTYLIILIQFAQLTTESQKTSANSTHVNQAPNYPYYYLHD